MKDFIIQIEKFFFDIEDFKGSHRFYSILDTNIESLYLLRQIIYYRKIEKPCMNISHQLFHFSQTVIRLLK